MSVSPPPVAEGPGEGPGPVESTFRPYVPDSAELPELTGSAVALGAVLGIVFGASSLYLFLKVGMTVSASIPVAVLSITIFRAFSKAFGTRRATILENNIVQTTGSAGESIAFGVGATMPALMILGYDMEPLRVMLVSVLGGLLGILMMIPLRRAFIVKQHGELKYPEGAACAKILVVGEQGGSSAQTVFTGFGLAFVYQVMMEAMNLWAKVPGKLITGIQGYTKAMVMCEVSPALLGVGYIIGTRTASVMVGGGLLTSLVLVPMIAYFGDGLSTPLPPGTKLIHDLGPDDLSRSYVRYIGAGAVAAGGIISMCRALPLIFGSLAGSVSAFRSGGGQEPDGRTQRDLPMAVVGIGALGLVAAIAASHLIPTNPAGRIVGALMILLFGFLFVTVSSRITGEIGSSSNPISGMTIATLLLTCLIFYVLGWVGEQYRVTALSIAAIVCIASSNGGTISQDLKTGFLVGATPRAQQLSILVGALTSAIVIGFTLILLNNVYTDVTSDPQYLPQIKAPVATLTRTENGPDGRTYKVWWVSKTIEGVRAGEGAEPGRYLVDDSGTAHYRVDPGIYGVVKKHADGKEATKFSPPQPALFAVIIDGIMTGQLAWALVVLGAALAVVMQLAGVSALAFAVGVYLPLATTLPIFGGGLVRALVDRFHKLTPEESDSSPSVLLSSGLIAGSSIAGILLAVLAVVPSVGQFLDLTKWLPSGWSKRPLPALVAFGVLIAVLAWVGLRAAPAAAGKVELAKRGEIEAEDLE